MTGRVTEKAERFDLDLDARRREAGAKPLKIKFGGKAWTLPAELPLEFTAAMAAGDLLGAVRSLFDTQADDLLAVRPPVSIDDLLAIAERYGTSLGEVLGSAASSPSTATP